MRGGRGSEGEGRRKGGRNWVTRGGRRKEKRKKGIFCFDFIP